MNQEQVSYSIAIVGAGQLGSRHLQSLTQIKVSSDIYVVDINQKSLDISEDRYNSMENSSYIKSVLFTHNISDLPDKVDLLIVATNSDKRSNILKEIVGTKTVKNIILEKVLFQTIFEYHEIKKLFDDNMISAWVNCPLRTYELYNRIKATLNLAAPVICTVDGGNWGLACNSIHFIDMFSFLVNCSSYKMDISGLDNDIIKSKREGFIEFTGVLNCKFDNKGLLIINSRKNSDKPIVITINDDEKLIVIEESLQKYSIFRKLINDDVLQSDFQIPFQSQLTSFVAESILLEKKCNLTDYDNSMILHLPLLEGLLTQLNLNSEEKMNTCPIT
jgi:hypothetical protein